MPPEELQKAYYEYPYYEDSAKVRKNNVRTYFGPKDTRDYPKKTDNKYYSRNDSRAEDDAERGYARGYSDEDYDYDDYAPIRYRGKAHYKETVTREEYEGGQNPYEAREDSYPVVHAYVWEIRYDPWQGKPIPDEETHRFIRKIIYDEDKQILRLVGDFDPRDGRLLYSK